MLVSRETADLGPPGDLIPWCQCGPFANKTRSLAPWAGRWAGDQARWEVEVPSIQGGHPGRSGLVVEIPRFQGHAVASRPIRHEYPDILVERVALVSSWSWDQGERGGMGPGSGLCLDRRGTKSVEAPRSLVPRWIKPADSPSATGSLAAISPLVERGPRRPWDRGPLYKEGTLASEADCDRLAPRSSSDRDASNTLAGRPTGDHVTCADLVRWGAWGRRQRGTDSGKGPRWSMRWKCRVDEGPIKARDQGGR